MPMREKLPLVECDELPGTEVLALLFEKRIDTFIVNYHDSPVGRYNAGRQALNMSGVELTHEEANIARFMVVHKIVGSCDVNGVEISHGPCALR